METVITVLIIIFAALDVLSRAARRRAPAEREAERRTAGPLPRRAPAPPDERPAPLPAYPPAEGPGEGPPPGARVAVPGEPPSPPSWTWLRPVRREPRVDFPGPAFSGDAGIDAATLRAVMAWSALLGPPRARRPWRPPGFFRGES